MIRNALAFLACIVLPSPLSAAAQQAATGYDQPLRPQVHFSPQRNWTNDPNGLVFFEGEYHLFFQYNPMGDQWGHMSWGHAVSPDLLHWTELPVALPEHNGEMIFTGSVVVDEHNTSGFCDAGTPCLVAVYTSHREHPQYQAQSLAYSRDRGRTWTFFPGNPVLDLGLADFRDPNVSWNDDAHAWGMAVSLPNEHKVAFYTSPDLKHWTRTSTFGPAGDTAGQWECPDLVRVPYADAAGSTWALKVGLNPGALHGGSGEQYFLGSFDGRAFHAQRPDANLWTDYGKDSYCAISYNHLPASSSPVLLGWMSNWDYAAHLPTSPWRGQMTIPRRLAAVHTPAGDVLTQSPVLDGLRVGAAATIHATLRQGNATADLAHLAPPSEIEVQFTPAETNEPFGLRLYADADHFVEVGFDPARHKLYVDRTHGGANPPAKFAARTEAPLPLDNVWDLHLVVDRSSVEVFAQHGAVAMTNLVLSPAPLARLTGFGSSSGKPLKIAGHAWRLQSVWTQKGQSAPDAPRP